MGSSEYDARTENKSSAKGPGPLATVHDKSPYGFHIVVAGACLLSLVVVSVVQVLVLL